MRLHDQRKFSYPVSILMLSLSLFLLHTCFSSAGFYNAWFPEVLQPLSTPRVPAAMVVGSILVPTTDE